MSRRVFVAVCVTLKRSDDGAPFLTGVTVKVSIHLGSLANSVISRSRIHAHVLGRLNVYLYPINPPWGLSVLGPRQSIENLSSLYFRNSAVGDRLLPYCDTALVYILLLNYTVVFSFKVERERRRFDVGQLV